MPCRVAFSPGPPCSLRDADTAKNWVTWTRSAQNWGVPSTHPRLTSAIQTPVAASPPHPHLRPSPSPSRAPAAVLPIAKSVAALHIPRSGRHPVSPPPRTPPSPTRRSSSPRGFSLRLLAVLNSSSSLSVKTREERTPAMPGRSLPSPFDAAVTAGEIRADQLDPDYLYFLQHVRPDGNSYVLDLPARGDSPPVTLKYETKTPHDGEAQIACAPSPVRAKSDRRAEEENLSADTPWYGLDANIDADYREWLRNTRAVDGHLVLEVGSEVVHYHDYKVDEAWPVVCSKAGREEEEGQGEVAAVAASGKDGVGEEEKVVALISTDGPMAVASEPDVCDRPEQKIGGEKLLNELPVKATNTVKEETNSSNGALALGLHGVVWPTHIIERPESGFKERLMHVLSKPFSRDEYDTVLGRATIRVPVRKERRTRRGVKYYYSKHEKNKSYFDSFPDLAEQVEGTSYPNRLALLRGFFFWLENVGHEDQFRPWRDDFTHYKVISSVE